MRIKELTSVERIGRSQLNAGVGRQDKQPLKKEGLEGGEVESRTSY
jgi:hypothetical protein